MQRDSGLVQNVIPFAIDNSMLQRMDTVYTTSRYPSDIGLLPEGKPTKELALQLFEFAKYIYDHTYEMVNDKLPNHYSM